MLGQLNTTSFPYFYASKKEADFYDDSVRFTARAYDLVHEVTVRLLETWISQHYTKIPSRTNLFILDIGCGTGAEAMQTLARLPQSKILCIDNSAEMIEIFRKKLHRAYGDDTACGRVNFVLTDFRVSGWLDRALAEIRHNYIIESFDAAISVYALHHLLPEIKGDVYRAISDRLRPDSIFVNADLFSFPIPWLSDLAQEEEENWIYRQFGETMPGWLGATFGPSRIHLRDAWIKHIREENIPLPIALENAGYEQGKTCEEMLLREAGFASIIVPARLYQSAVMIATK